MQCRNRGTSYGAFFFFFFFPLERTLLQTKCGKASGPRSSTSGLGSMKWAVYERVHTKRTYPRHGYYGLQPADSCCIRAQLVGIGDFQSDNCYRRLSCFFLAIRNDGKSYYYELKYTRLSKMNHYLGSVVHPLVQFVSGVAF